VHQSAIAALVLSGAIPVFVEPDYDSDWDIAHSMTPAKVQAALERHPDSRAVMLVSPTYYGVVGDIAAIAQITHQFNLPLFVDEAHGAHFYFHPDLPPAALAAGADLVVQSTHKVLGAMTQAAMLHLKGDRVDPNRLSRTLQLVQSTSPSYLLLASLDAARQQVALHGMALMTQTLQLAAKARTGLQRIPGLRVFSRETAIPTPGFVTLDQTRLTVEVSGLGLTGFEADEQLHQTLGVTAELPSLRHLTFIISLGNTDADIDRLIAAFTALATAAPSPCPLNPIRPQWFKGTEPELLPALSPRDAFFAPSESVAIAQAPNRISAELVCPYPPGIPVLLPGERITADAIANLQAILLAGGIITGCADPSLHTLKVVRNIPMTSSLWSYKTPGIPDELFEQLPGIPLSKREIRLLIISHLRLKVDAVFWDIGAGTGTITVEVGLLCPQASIIAIERDEEVASLIRRNCDRFAVQNVKVIEGSAPECLAKLVDAPDCVCIEGGRSVKAILLVVWKHLRPQGRVVATATNFESLYGISESLAELRARNIEVVQSAVNRLETRGNNQLFVAVDPIFILSGEKLD